MRGALVFKGTRVPVRTLVDHLVAGDSLHVSLEDFPSVSREQAVAFLEARAAEEDAKIASHPDARIDALWAAEAENRIAEYESGQTEAFDADEVLASEAALLSEASLSDWKRPEEHMAWAHLQGEPPLASVESGMLDP